MFGRLFATAFAACIVWFVFVGVTGLRKNVKAARESGLPWFIARKLIHLSSGPPDL